MFFAVHHLGFEVHHGIPGQDACLHPLDHPFLHAGNVPLGDASADHAVDELELLSPGQGLDLQDDLGVLAMSPGLLLVLVLRPRLLADRLPVGDARDAGIHLDLGLSPDLFQNDVQMQLPHARDDRFSGLLVVVDLERQILFRGPLKHLVHLVLVLLGDCIDGHRVHGPRKLQRKVDHGLVRQAEGVVGVHRGHLVQNPNVPGNQRVRLFELLALAGVGLGHLLPLVLPGVQQLGVSANHPGHDLDE